VIFTQNTTYALNIAIKGALRQGDHVLISELEHNAVRRPIERLAAEKGVTYDIFPVLGLPDTALLQGIQKRIQPGTRAVICTHASNICGVSLPLATIGRLCRRAKLYFIVDGAQSAGILPINMREMRIDALAVPAHKSLYGIQGCGALCLGERFLPAPLTDGGSGVDSMLPHMPDEPPERFEAGTLPTPAIAALYEGVRSLEGGISAEIHARECQLFRALRERLEALPSFRLYAPQHEGAIALFSHRTLSSDNIAAFLAARGICVRAGLHCAPLAHQALGTPKDGAVRVSFGRYNTLAEVDLLARTLAEI
jgi:selenocysteine lyase/cysteine desulfurase